MKEKTRKIFIMIVMAALIVSLMAASFAALTYGRYAGGRRDENSPYEDYIDFVGATAYEVKTPEQFVNAINSGYSYIKIAADAEKPFVVNNDIANVYTNLVIDVNGNTVIRNSRNPVLDVRRNISVVLVYDSSVGAEGGFYNPVGSALQTSGGTLTVGAGSYESGPKTDTDSSVSGNVSATVYSREVRTGKEYTLDESTAQLPKLTKDVYLENNVTEGYLRNDTYLIYTKENNCYEKDGQLFVNCTKTSDSTISGTSFRVESNVASCDFYYYYPVGTANEDGFQTYAVVYGYNDVKALASNEDGTAATLQDSGLVWPYAAIRSEDGNTHARGGAFSTYFGTQNTYGIYTEGGIMTVGSAGSSSAAGPAFKAVGEGVCISMSAEDEDTLTISGGSFSSEIGNTIEMSGGAMTVTRGSFTKSGGKGIAGGDNAQITNQTAIIDIQGGTLTINGAAANSVTLTAGSAVTNPDGTVTYSGTLQNVFGIRAEGGTVTTSGCTFNISGDYSAGVLSYNGTINLDDNTVINVTQSETATVLTSAGVSSEQASEDGEHPVKLSGDVTITSNGLGITARGAVNVTEGESTVTTSRGTGIYVNNGSFTVDSMAAITVNSTVKSGYSWATPPGTGSTNPPNIFNGVYVQGGSLVSNGTLNVTFTGVENESHKSYDALKIRSYAVRVEAAATGGNSEVSIAGGTISNSVGGGVYVGGGTVTLGVRDKGGPTIGTTGVSFGNENTSAGGGNWKYYENKTGGHAVEVSGGDLLVYGGLYTAALGNGILVRGGNAWVLNGTFQGNDTGNYRDNYGEGNLPAGPAAYYALKLLGGSVTTFGGTFGTYVVGDATYTAEGSSAFVTGVSSQATANIYGGSFKVGGQAGFSVYQNVALEFTPNEEETVNGQTLKGSDVTVSATTTAIAIENTIEQNVSVTINGGTFESTRDDSGQRDGIWYSNPYAKLTINQLDGQKTTISAKAKHGINLVYAPAIENGVTISGDCKITGKQDGIHYGSNGTAANGLLISGGTITGSNGSGLNLAGALYATHAVVITGGTFNGGQYGAYYDEDGGGGDGDNQTPTDHVNDGLLITGGSFKGNTYGFYFNDNPWSRLNEVAYNNVAIVGGTFSSFGVINNDGSIKAGDVFTMHVEYNGKRQYGVDEDEEVYGDATAGNGAVVHGLGEIELETKDY